MPLYHTILAPLRPSSATSTGFYSSLHLPHQILLSPHEHSLSIYHKSSRSSQILLQTLRMCYICATTLSYFHLQIHSLSAQTRLLPPHFYAILSLVLYPMAQTHLGIFHPHHTRCVLPLMSYISTNLGMLYYLDSQILHAHISSLSLYNTPLSPLRMVSVYSCPMGYNISMLSIVFPIHLSSSMVFAPILYQTTYAPLSSLYPNLAMLPTQSRSPMPNVRQSTHTMAYLSTSYRHTTLPNIYLDALLRYILSIYLLAKIG